MPESVLTVLKLCFLALLYLFLFRVVRVVWAELRAPALTPAPPPVEQAPRAGRGDRGTMHLRVVEPPAHRGETFPVGDEVTVGRGGGCGIVLVDDRFVSTLHARLFRRDGHLYVEDLGSRNGTFLNGHRVGDPTRVRRGDIVQFGDTVAELVR